MSHMNKQYRLQRLQKRMSKIMLSVAVESANQQTTEEFFSGQPFLVGK